MSTEAEVTNFIIEDKFLRVKSYHRDNNTGIVNLNQTHMGQHFYRVSKNDPDFVSTSGRHYLDQDNMAFTLRIVRNSTLEKRYQNIKTNILNGKRQLAFNELLEFKNKNEQLYRSKVCLKFRNLEKEILYFDKLVASPEFALSKEILINILTLSGRKEKNEAEVDKIIQAFHNEDYTSIGQQIAENKNFSSGQIGIINSIINV